MQTQTNSNIDHTTLKLKQMQVKILYWGPGEAGKTTNYHQISKIFKKYSISSGISIETTDERTLWNDSMVFKFVFEQLNVEFILLLGTTTGQERFLSTREYVLQNSDGIIFVADSSLSKIKDNLRSFEELKAFINDKNIPILFLLNKRDLSDAIEVDTFLKVMNLPKNYLNKDNIKIPYESIANSPNNLGDVKQIFWDLIKLILKNRLIGIGK